MASKSGRTTNFSEEEKLLLAELGKEFPEVEGKGLGRNSEKFNSQNPNGIKRDMNQIQGCWRRLKVQSEKEHDLQRRESRKTGGGKAPASPSQVCKLVADVIPGSITPLEQEFDDDTEEEPNLRRDTDENGTITCEAGPSGLADVEVITWKGAKLKKKDSSQK